MKRSSIIFLTIASIITWLNGCGGLYQVNNLVYLGYPVETSLRSSLVQAYCDTLINKYGYNVPSKWSHLNRLVELDSINNKRIYFRSNPEEMYLISFGGMLILNDVYNPAIVNNGYISRRDLMPKEQELRIKERFKIEILDKIEAMAKQDGLPDSVIYKHPPYSASISTADNSMLKIPHTGAGL